MHKFQLKPTFSINESLQDDINKSVDMSSIKRLFMIFGNWVPLLSFHSLRRHEMEPNEHGSRIRLNCLSIFRDPKLTQYLRKL